MRTKHAVELSESTGGLSDSEELFLATNELASLPDEIAKAVQDGDMAEVARLEGRERALSRRVEYLRPLARRLTDDRYRGRYEELSAAVVAIQQKRSAIVADAQARIAAATIELRQAAGAAALLRSEWDQALRAAGDRFGAGAGELIIPGDTTLAETVTVPADPTR